MKLILSQASWSCVQRAVVCHPSQFCRLCQKPTRLVVSSRCEPWKRWPPCSRHPGNKCRPRPQQAVVFLRLSPQMKSLQLLSSELILSGLEEHKNRVKNTGLVVTNVLYQVLQVVVDVFILNGLLRRKRPERGKKTSVKSQINKRQKTPVGLSRL